MHQTLQQLLAITACNSHLVDARFSVNFLKSSGLRGHVVTVQGMAEQRSGVEDVGAAHGEQVVTPWEAHAGEGQTGIDYDKLIS